MARTKTPRRAEGAGKRAAPLPPPTMTVESKALASALATVGPALAKGDALPALQCAHVVIENEVATIAATDLDLGIVTTCPVSRSAPGQMLVPAKLLEQLLRDLGEHTTIALVRGKVKVTSGTFSALLPTYPVTESNMVVAPEGRSFEVPPGALGDALLRVLPAVSTDANRTMLQHVAVDIEGEFARFVGTDSFRMAVADTEMPAWADHVLLIPSTFARLVAGAMARSERAVVTVDDDAVAVAVEDKIVVTKLYDQEYVPYRRLMEAKHTTRVVAGRTDLLAAVRRTRLVAGAKPVYVIVEGDQLSVAATGEADASASEQLMSVVTRSDDGPLRVPFNGKFLIDALATVGGEEVAVELLDDRKQAHVVPVGVAGVVHVLMPVRLDPAASVPDGEIDDSDGVGDEGADELEEAVDAVAAEGGAQLVVVPDDAIQEPEEGDEAEDEPDAPEDATAAAPAEDTPEAPAEGSEETPVG
jgi:DNA polymerase-3 subunit beta